MCELVSLLSTVPHVPGQHNQPTPTALAQKRKRVYACLGVTYNLHFWQSDRGLLLCHCGDTRVDRTPNESQHRRLTLEKKILSPLLSPGTLSKYNIWCKHIHRDGQSQQSSTSMWEWSTVDECKKDEEFLYSTHHQSLKLNWQSTPRKCQHHVQDIREHFARAETNQWRSLQGNKSYFQVFINLATKRER